MAGLTNETDVDSNNFFAEMLLKGIGAFRRRRQHPRRRRVVESFAETVIPPSTPSTAPG